MSAAIIPLNAVMKSRGYASTVEEFVFQRPYGITEAAMFGEVERLQMIHQIVDAAVSAIVVTALGRAGVPLRTRAQSAGIRRAREAAGRGEYPWAAEAAERHQAGTAVSALAREYKASARTVKAVIGRQGVAVTVRRYARRDTGGGAA